MHLKLKINNLILLLNYLKMNTDFTYCKIYCWDAYIHLQNLKWLILVFSVLFFI